MRPLLKWAGGKSRLAPQICEAFGSTCHGTYYEPFCGSAAVLLYRRALGEVDKAVLADVNPKLVAVHVAVRDQVEAVLSALDALPSEDWRERYYEMRDAYNTGPWHGPEHAARFLWLNRAGFNGLYRENRKGEFNVPVGRYAALKLPSRDRFLEVSALLQGVDIVAAGFADIMRLAGDDDQVYCDPPYVPLTASANFTGYQQGEFGASEQRDLALAARRAAFNGARVVLSNHDLPIVRHELYPPAQGFVHVARPRVARAISRTAVSRGKVGEVIAAIGPMAEVA